MDETIRERAARVEGLIPRVLRAMFNPSFQDPLAEVPLGQMRMLRLLAMKTWTPSSLGEELGLSVSAVTQMANRLEGIGFAERIEDPSDRRVKHLSLTTLGKEMMTRRFERRVERLESVLSQLPESRQIELLTMLEELIEAGAKVEQSAENSLYTEAEVEHPHSMPPA